MKRSFYVWGLLILILIIDQWSKIWIKLNMPMGDSFLVFGQAWFRIYFIENPGMAFGMELGGSYGKLILSVFRIIACFGIAYYLWRWIKEEKSLLFLCTITLILAGAVGNIIDCAFYGLIFTESSPIEPATMTAIGEGYAPFLHGRVVDMLYFPLFEVQLPFMDKPFRFFEPIFNIADTSISIGVALLLIFHKRFFPEDKNKETAVAEEKSMPMNTLPEDKA